MSSFQRSFGKVVRLIIKEILTTVIPALILAFLLTHFVGERVVVYSQSMEPNLHEEQQIIVEKASYYFQVPERGSPERGHLEAPIAGTRPAAPG